MVGAGLAGCEAAWQAARRGLCVALIEMKPERFSAAHGSPDFAELVCSNSLRSNQLGNAVGLLKEEMRRLDSLILAAADESAVPAGKALAVDRVAFARRITETRSVTAMISLSLWVMRTMVLPWAFSCLRMRNRCSASLGVSTPGLARIVGLDVTLSELAPTSDGR